MDKKIIGIIGIGLALLILFGCTQQASNQNPATNTQTQNTGGTTTPNAPSTPLTGGSQDIVNEANNSTINDSGGNIGDIAQ